MWNEPSKEELGRLPRLYETEDVESGEKVIYLHLFIGGMDFYLAEYDPESGLFFGFTLNRRCPELSEWGYLSLDELREVKVKGFEVDRDLDWMPKRFKEIPEINSHLNRNG